MGAGGPGPRSTEERQSLIEQQSLPWRRSLAYGLPLALSLLAVVSLFSLSFGSSGLSPGEAGAILLGRLPGLGYLHPDVGSGAEAIVLRVRLPRVVLGILVGAALSLAGAAFQGLLRNPLADPFTLGVSSGAAVGAASVMAAGGVVSVPMGALAGGLAALGTVYRLARVGGRLAGETLILAGVVISSFGAALLALVISLSTERLQDIFFWLMGSLALRSWSQVLFVALVLVPVYLFLTLAARELNLLALGEEEALSLGVDVQRLRRSLLLWVSLLTAAVVSVSGTIGFVGLVVPHVVRLLAGPDHRALLPLAAVGGGAFLVAADLASRLLLAPRELPIGAVTALLGAPFFGYLLRRRKRDYFSSR